MIKSQAGEVETIDFSLEKSYPITAKTGNSSLIQLPMEPLATNVGDPSSWLVEKMEKVVSIKPIQKDAPDTNLAILTRQGTLNFSVRLANETESCTHMVRVSQIVDAHQTLPPNQAQAETLANVVIREIRIAQNFYALKQVDSPEIKEIEHLVQAQTSRDEKHSCTLLQTFRFKDARHVLLHFITENTSDKPIHFDCRRTLVLAGDTVFVPLSVSLGKNTLNPKSSVESFIVLNGGSGLRLTNSFKVVLFETEGSDS